MNKQGINYCENIEKGFNQYQGIKPSFSSSQTMERKMRLGIEVSMYGIDIKDDKQLERVAIATLKDDFLKRHKTK